MLTSDQARQLEGRTGPHAHMGKTWKQIHSESGAGRFRRSPSPGSGPKDGPGLHQRGTDPGVRARSTPTRSSRPRTTSSAVRRRPTRLASALYDEVEKLGDPLSYQSFVRQVRAAGLRRHCEACHGVEGHDTIEIDHPPGEEIEWTWFERRTRPGKRRPTCRWARCRTRARCGRVGREDGSGPPHRGDGRSAAATRRDATGVADRPAGDGDRAGTRESKRPSFRWPSATAPSSSRVRPGAAIERERSSPACASSRVAGGGPWGPQPEEAQRSLDVFCAKSVTSGTSLDQTASAAPSASWPTPSRPCSALGPVPGHDRGLADRRRQRNGGPSGGNRYRRRLASPEERRSSGTVWALPVIEVVAPSGTVLVARSPRPGRDRVPWCAVSSTKRPSRSSVPSAFTTARRTAATRRRTGPPGRQALEEGSTPPRAHRRGLPRR